jgi:hypothetical protein
VAHADADAASLAVAYTTLGRAIGVTDNVAALNNVSVDTYFWKDATQQAVWRGPITTHATRGTFTGIAAATPLDDANVVGPLRAQQVVLIRGRFQATGGGFGTHWMLATSFITDSGNNITGVVANDPWTGLQVEIDPSTKRVISPANFPLTKFTVNGFQTVTLN